MSKTKPRYKLLTTAIVSAIHPNQPQRVGSVWEPTDRSHTLEAEALHKAGFAEPTDAKATVNVLGTAVIADADEEADEQDEELKAILAGSVEDVEAALDDLNEDDLRRLAELEKVGKDRKGVADAIAQYLDAE